uniref:Uncharacterized protein n=1 Tax=Cajanus cajan TaxID=3821 RepID=A0A151SJD4_CAJCA|nr:hypothetical protein KK1_001099 [Cajanus cajan]
MKILHNALLTDSKRQGCHLSTSIVFPRCLASFETTLHVLRDYPQSRELWTSSGINKESLYYQITFYTSLIVL